MISCRIGSYTLVHYVYFFGLDFEKKVRFKKKGEGNLCM